MNMSYINIIYIIPCHNPSREADSRWAGQTITHVLWNMKFNYQVRKSLQLSTIPIQLNQIHIFMPYFIQLDKTEKWIFFMKVLGLHQHNDLWFAWFMGVYHRWKCPTVCRTCWQNSRQPNTECCKYSFFLKEILNLVKYVVI